MPVTPATSRARVGSPKKTSAATAIAIRASSTSSWGNVELEWALDDQRRGTRRDGATGELVPVGARPGTQKNSVPGTTRSAS